MRKKCFIFLCFMFILFVACDLSLSSKRFTTIHLSIKSPLQVDSQFNQSRALLSFAGQKITIKAEAPGMETLEEVLVFDENTERFTGTITVLKGLEVKFTVEAKDVNGNVYVSGNQTKLMAKDNETIAITLAPVLEGVEEITESTYESGLMNAKIGTVTSVIFAPNIKEKTSFTCNAGDLAYVFCDRQGNNILDGNNTWSMKKGEEIIILFAKAGEHSSFSISLTNTPKYTITFNANDGTGEMETQTVESDTPTTLKENTFDREDYAFIGWNTQADGSGQNYEVDQNITLTEDLTLYAQWKQISTVKITVAIGADGELTINDDKDIEPLTTTDTLKITITPTAGVEISDQQWILVNRVLEDDDDLNTISISLEGYMNVLSLGDNVLTFYYTCNGVSHTELIRFTINAN